MADATILELPEKISADSNDVLVIVDVNTNTTKKIEAGKFASSSQPTNWPITFSFMGS